MTSNNHLEFRLPIYELAVVALLSLCLEGCGEDPLKGWSNAKLHSHAKNCENTKKHTPRSAMICQQVEDACSFRDLSCR